MHYLHLIGSQLTMHRVHRAVCRKKGRIAAHQTQETLYNQERANGKLDPSRATNMQIIQSTINTIDSIASHQDDNLASNVSAKAAPAA